jgi:hypothetical protein
MQVAHSTVVMRFLGLTSTWLLMTLVPCVVKSAAYGCEEARAHIRSTTKKPAKMLPPDFHGVMMQAFHWYIDAEKPLWVELAGKAKVWACLNQRGAGSQGICVIEHVPLAPPHRS